MLVLRLWNYFRGYVLIKIEGLSLEKFINYAIARGIFLWDIRRIDYTTMEAKVGLRAYKELRHVVKKAGCRVKIKVKIGYPFFMYKIKKRKIFMGGFIFFLISIFIMTSFIWSIDVKGCETINPSEIKNYVKNHGVKIGEWKYDVNREELEKKIIIDFNKIAWVGMEFKGTKALIEIVEKVEPPPKINKHMPCDIIAKKDGVIKRVIAKEGDALVKEGDIVKKGQCLVTGIIAREGVENRYVHAFGEVMAKTYYEERDEISLINVEKIKTGEKKTKRIIKLGNSQIIWGEENIPYKNVLMERKHKTLPKWRNSNFPVEVIIEEYYEVNIRKNKLNKSNVKKMLFDKMMVNVYEIIPKDGKIINKNIVFTEENSIIKGKLIVEVLENISIQKPIRKEEIIEEKKDLEE
ncbi:MAG: sporulation protein YqfD [Anaeromicrobium sp.]|uniref:sporulation protein YqfD n=1 Tax=Anaeromicrobium sp. TaxID=1929132 RepID=UPI0025F033E1|nr:sporulation protein YqfD [Anaeromicrobium sp.]MCT4594593.1 sporulation protein YqfD [Anaeromicrobium sp.]